MLRGQSERSQPRGLVGMTMFSLQRAIARSTGLRDYGYHTVKAMRAGKYDHVVQLKVSKEHTIQRGKRVEHNTGGW